MQLFPLILISFVYFISFSYGVMSVNYVFEKVNIFTEYATYASLVFFPHGMRVLCAWIYREQSILYLLPVSLYTHYINNPNFDSSYLLIIPGILSGYFAFLVFSYIFPKSPIWASQMQNEGVYKFKNVFVVILISALINSSLSTFLLIVTNKIELSQISVLFQYGIGDVVGAILLMFIILYSIKFAKAFRYND